MSHPDELDPAYQRRVDAAVGWMSVGEALIGQFWYYVCLGLHIGMDLLFVMGRRARVSGGPSLNARPDATLASNEMLRRRYLGQPGR